MVKAVEWTVIKLGFNKFWVWLRTYWQIPFLILWTMLVYFLTRRNTDAIIEVLNAKQDAHKKEVDALNRAHDDKILKLKNLNKQYEETIKKLEERFAEEDKKLTEKHIKDVKKVVIESKGNPDEVINKIEKTFGITFKKI